MRINKGYVFAVVAVFLYAIADAISKYYVASYDVAKVMFVRTVARCAPFVFIALFREVNPYKTKNVGLNLLRGLCASGISYTFLAAYKFAPMTDVIVVSQSSAIIVIPLSILFLGESFSLRTVSAVSFGFAGIVCAFRPSENIFQIGVLFALLAAILSAVNKVLIRKLTFTDNELTMIFYHESILLVLSSISGANFSLPGYVVFPLIISGLISALALFLMLHAYKFAECTHIAPTSYLILIPSVVIDLVIYNRQPDFYIISGAALIIVGAVIANYRKH